MDVLKQDKYIKLNDLLKKSYKMLLIKLLCII